MVPTEIKIRLQPKKLNGPRKSRCIDEIFYVHHVTVTWLMWCLRYFQFECLPHLQSQAAQALHLKLDEFEFSRYFIEINKENTSLNLPIVCSCGGLVGQNVLPLKGLFTWSGGPRSSGVSFFCFHALGDTKQKKLTPLDWGPPLHVNRP